MSLFISKQAALAADRPRGLMVRCPPSLAIQAGHVAELVDGLVHSPFSLQPMPAIKLRKISFGSPISIPLELTVRVYQEM